MGPQEPLQLPLNRLNGPSTLHRRPAFYLKETLGVLCLLKHTVHNEQMPSTQSDKITPASLTASVIEYEKKSMMLIAVSFTDGTDSISLKNFF